MKDFVQVVLNVYKLPTESVSDKCKM